MRIKGNLLVTEMSSLLRCQCKIRSNKRTLFNAETETKINNLTENYLDIYYVVTTFCCSVFCFCQNETNYVDNR
jgi:hypothetical protein